MSWRGLLALGAGLALVGCADFGDPISGGAPLPPREARLQAMEERLGELTRRVENLNFAAQTQESQRLEAELRGLRGDVERLRYDVDTAEQRNRQLYQDLDQRLQKLENEGRTARLTLEPRLSSAPPVPASADEEAAYLAIFEQLKAGQYDGAISGFEDMLQQWPDGAYADNARYWMGEAHFVKREFTAAADSFEALLEAHPQSPKVPDALFKLGMARQEQGQVDDAKAAWQQLLKAHGNSHAAGMARERLESLP